MSTSLTVIPACGFFTGKEIGAANYCGAAGGEVARHVCIFCRRNPDRRLVTQPLAPIVPMDPAVAAAILRQISPCSGCGDHNPLMG